METNCRYDLVIYFQKAPFMFHAYTKWELIKFTCCAKSSQCGSQCGTKGGGGGLAEAQGGRSWSRLARTLWKKRGALGRAVEGRWSVKGASAQSTPWSTLLLRLLGSHGTEWTISPTTQTTIGTTSRCSCCCNCKKREEERKKGKI